MLVLTMLLVCDTVAELPKVTNKERLAFVVENFCFYVAVSGKWIEAGALNKPKK